MTKAEHQSELSTLQNDLYQNEWSYSQDELKTLKRTIRKHKKAIQKLTPELTPGTEISLEDFIIQINNSATKEKPMLKFFKEEDYRFAKDETEILKDMLRNEYGVYAHFNRHYTPSDIKRIRGKVVKEESKSNNIYSVMTTPQTTEIRDEFKVVVQWREEPITVFKEYTKNTTLSMRDVNNFM